MESNNNLAGLLARFVSILKEETLLSQTFLHLEHTNCSAEIERINSAGSLLQQAILCFVEYPQRYAIQNRCQEIITAIVEYPGVAEGLKEWRGERQQNIFHLAFANRCSFLLGALIKKIGGDLIMTPDQLGSYPTFKAEHLLLLKDLDEFQIIAKRILLAKNRPPLRWAWSLLPHLEFHEEDKLKIEDTLNGMTDHDFRVSDYVLCKIWYNTAQKFSGSEDINMATKIIIRLVQQPCQYTKDGLLSDMLKSYPGVNGDHILSSVKE